MLIKYGLPLSIIAARRSQVILAVAKPMVNGKRYGNQRYECLQVGTYMHAYAYSVIQLARALVTSEYTWVGDDD